jgi:hypothetical protein
MEIIKNKALDRNMKKIWIRYVLSQDILEHNVLDENAYSCKIKFIHYLIIIFIINKLWTIYTTATGQQCHNIWKL